MATYEIPLTAEPQKFSISLSGVVYQINLYWNVPNQIWTVDISDNLGNLIVAGIPLVANSDLLAQYQYLNFRGKLFVQTDSSQTTPPNYKNLGSTGHVYFVAT